MKFFLLLLTLCSLSFSSFGKSSGADYADRFISYIKKYNDLHEKCFEMVPKGHGNEVLANTVQCIWRKDQVLLKKTNLISILYETAYNRYSSLFDLAKNIDYQMSIRPSHKKTVRLLLEYHKNARDIRGDTFESMKYDMTNYLKRNY
jgi:hypothetical protein